MQIRDLFFFDKFIIPKVITFMYWLMLLGAIVAGVGSMYTQGFFAGLVALVAGVIGVRIWCEVMMVFFKMNDHLAAMRKQAEQQQE